MIPQSDPRLTAYTLGEMTDDERRAFEAELTASDESQRLVSELAGAADLLRAELAKEPPPKLAAPHREKVERAAAVAPRAEGEAPADERAEKVAAVVPLRPSFGRRALTIAAPLAVAAGVAFVIANSSMKSDSAPASAPEDQGASRASAMATSRHFGMAAATATAAVDQPMASAWAKTPMPGRMKQDADGDDGLPPTHTGSVGLPENPFVEATKDPQSTFSIDVDTASYSLVRRLIESGGKPDASAVRIEEMVNYFTYSYPEPNDAAFGVYTDATAAPWAPEHRIVRIGLKGRTIDMAKRPASNLVFLIDASGSMEGADRLDLLKKGFELLVEQLDARDTVSIVAYAGASGLVLPPTKGTEKKTILAALDGLKAGGSTNGGSGIQLAYKTAKEHFVDGGSNRVILATDGDFNVGVTSHADLVKLVEDQAKSGTFLTVLGFGLGNLKDHTMEQLADKGNGNYAYVDSVREARKVLVDQAAGTLNTIAKDVKIQVTFDPKSVQSFRLIGYENRVLAHKDFEDDTKDAGEIGAGHTVTALYEIVPKGAGAGPTHVADVALRYKMPDGATSKLVETKVVDAGEAFSSASTDLRFAASVAGFGMLLRGSPHKGDLTFSKVVDIANGATGDDADGHRREFVGLVMKAGGIGK